MFFVYSLCLGGILFFGCACMHVPDQEPGTVSRLHCKNSPTPKLLNAN